MKRFGKGFLIALGMFTVVPVPFFEWDEDSMALVFPCLPLVGGVVGGLWALGAWGLALWNPPVMLYGAFLVLLPILLTGMIHLDGFMDVMDALLSCREREERLRILKDPHMGALGTAAFGILLALTLCCGVTLAQSAVPPLLFLFVPILSRAMVSVLAAIIPPLSTTGYMASFYRPRGRLARWAQGLFTLAVLLAPGLLLGLYALLPMAVLAVAAAGVGWFLSRQFGGLSGDLCGCVITLSECSALLCMALMIGG